MANGLSDDLAQAALMGQTPEEEQNNLMQAGLGLGGAAFAAQVGRAPAPVPMGGQLSPLAQQVAQNDAARQAAVRQAAAASRPIGSNLPANPASPAVGSSGGTRLPSNPSVAAARQAAATSAQRVVPSLASRALPMLGQGGAAFSGGYTLGSVLDNAFDISGNIARGLFPDAPTLTREERAALGQADAEPETILAAADDSIIGDTQPTSRFQNIISQAAMGQIPMGPGGPTSGFVTPAQAASGVVATEAARKMLFSPERPSFSQAVQQQADQPFAQAAFGDIAAPAAPAAAEESVAPAMDTINDVMSRAGVPTQDQLVRAIQAPTQAAQPAMGLRTDPQGRMIPAGFETREEAFPEFESEAELRGQRLDARPDFTEAQRTGQPRGQRRYTDAQLRDIFPDPDDRKAAKAMDASGFDPVQKKSYADIEAGQAAQEAGFETEALRQQKMKLDIEELKKAGLPDDVEVVTDPSGLTLLYRNGQLFNAFRSQASQFTSEQMESIIKGENPFSTVQPTPIKDTTAEGDMKPKKGDIFIQGNRRYKFDGKNYELLD